MQGTYSTINNYTEDILTFSFPPVNKTIGGFQRRKYHQISIENNLLCNAFELVNSLENIEQKQFANNLLEGISTNIRKFRLSGYNLKYLPTIQASFVEDKSILFEWIFDDFRVGFNIECDYKHSSWFLVTSKKYDEYFGSGYLSEFDNDELIICFLDFIITNR